MLLGSLVVRFSEKRQEVHCFPEVYSSRRGGGGD